MADEGLVSFGVDATTSRYAGQPVDAAAIARLVLDEQAPVGERTTVRAKVQANEPNWSPVFGIDPNDLTQCGWALVAPHDCPADILDALTPLRELRRAEAGSAYREFTGKDGYRPGESAEQFLDRHLAGADQPTPDHVPYYVLLVGTPDQIPFRFQYQLDVQYAVGRLSFDDPSEYGCYAASVACDASKQPTTPRRAVFFGPCHEDDPATRLGCTQLVTPAFEAVRTVAGQWCCTLATEKAASKRALTNVFAGDHAPSLLFSVAHGVEFPSGDPRQRATQGALVCQDWPGPDAPRGPMSEDWYFAAQDVTPTANVRGLIAFLFGCYSAGTPAQDYFPERSRIERRAIAPGDFTSNLARRLLTHERGSAHAIVGHVERTWSSSFYSSRGTRQDAAFQNALKMLTAGYRLGAAMEPFGQRHADYGNRIATAIDHFRSDSRLQPQDRALAELWTARNDARSFIVLGDPAVRVPPCERR